ncbi:hypothetical protein Micbo1qcDRAFT_208440 [Microdochium bolleyi]|uniref:Uncharacterized protein n=1 Tax=Microdochium bolleyi TaxID=196109 RepID=A0A136IQ35_9PEZI|nr:hypothetical protein Micbo1qcDRAFT_208440 [Microdochium bolleyi]
MASINPADPASAEVVDRRCHLSNLPEELICMIARFSAESYSPHKKAKSYSLLCRVSQRFAACVTGHLYQTINMNKFPFLCARSAPFAGGPALAKLLHTMASAPLLCEQIQNIDLHTPCEVSTSIARDMLRKSRLVFVQSHGQSFYNELRDTISADMRQDFISREALWAGCLALAIALAPNLRTLKLCAAWHHPALKFVLFTPNTSGNRIIDRIRNIYLRCYGRRLLPAPLGCQNLESLSMQKFRIAREDCYTDCQLSTRLDKCFLAEGAMPAVFLQQLIRGSTRLRELYVIDNFWGRQDGQEPDQEAYHCITPRQAGAILRAHGQSLVTLRICSRGQTPRAAWPAPAQGSIGSLCALSNVRTLCIDPRLLLPRRSRNPAALVACLPPHVEDLTLSSPTDRDYTLLLKQVGAIFPATMGSTWAGGLPRLNCIRLCPDTRNKFVTLRTLCDTDEQKGQELEAVGIKARNAGWVCLSCKGGSIYDLVFFKGCGPHKIRQFLNEYPTLEPLDLSR